MKNIPIVMVACFSSQLWDLKNGNYLSTTNKFLVLAPNCGI
ncbi:hypothetical protein DESAMIL20_1059 [Desulfurella amilsii]|uniref:Uncharacterized protein n=1 Tax=Desulfurella amilsii TaxID=1562698 RepID=A0A1X4XVD2_9BACT|nr:hypothetical protein DESAMIL20_1059 [Desulfurella amilsii]